MQLLFQDLKLIEPLLKALDNEGYTTPTPIQEQAIPIILNRKDLLGCAQTGTGKTAAFALPLLQLLCEDGAGLKEDTGLRSQRPIKALILTPTRELAIQIDESFAAYGKFTGMKHLVIFGGVPQQPQVHALQRGIDILVATPGRLLDLVDQRHVNLRDIQFFVLAEADRMLDMGFVHDVKKIIARLPQKRQTLFFSATMPPEIQKLAATILVNPSKVEVTPASTTAETVQQSLYFVEKKDKKSLLFHLLQNDAIVSALVFTRTKHGADKVAQGLSRAGIRAEAIHGNKSQNARQRALQSFKNRQTRILVATDIAARGIDIDELTHVINFELPNVPETYVHRIGRTGRAGASGIALSFCDAEEREFLHDIQKMLGGPIPIVEDHPHVMHASISSRPVTQAASFAGRDGSRGGNNGRNGSSDRGGRGRDRSNDNNNVDNGRNNGRGSGGRGNNGSGNQRRDNQPAGRPPVAVGQNRPPKPLQKRAEQPERALRTLEEIEREDDVKRPERQPHSDRQNGLQNDRQNGHQNGHQRTENQPAARKEAARPDKSLPENNSQRDLSGDGGLPFKVNQSSGDEKW
jgi:ATP-dependent RNA helicase RhlE